MNKINTKNKDKKNNENKNKNKKNNINKKITILTIIIKTLLTISNSNLIKQRMSS